MRAMYREDRRRNRTEAVAIVGAGDQGKVVNDILRGMRVHVCGYLDDAYPEGGPSILGDTSLVIEDRLRTANTLAMGIGDNRARSTKFFELGMHMPFINPIHPRAEISRWAKIADRASVTIHYGAFIGPDAHIGPDTIINTGAIVEHDCDVRPHVHIAPGAVLGGRVHVKEYAFVGMGALIRDGRTVGKDSVVGMGAVVVEDVPDGVTVMGNPAREK